MIQRFIELGQGFGDLYELIEIVSRNKDRIAHIFELSAQHQDKTVLSYAVALTPTQTGSFQPIYTCREGITLLPEKICQRKELMNAIALEHGHTMVKLTTKHSSEFAETDLYYAYLTGVLRMNHYIPPLQ